MLNPEKMRVRIRIDGELVTTMEVARKDYFGMISRIKDFIRARYFRETKAAGWELLL